MVGCFTWPLSAQVERVDYSCLLSPKFWLQAFAWGPGSSLYMFGGELLGKCLKKIPQMPQWAVWKKYAILWWPYILDSISQYIIIGHHIIINQQGFWTLFILFLQCVSCEWLKLATSVDSSQVFPGTVASPMDTKMSPPGALAPWACQDHASWHIRKAKMDMGMFQKLPDC
jgi:hypothetical protein